MSDEIDRVIVILEREIAQLQNALAALRIIRPRSFAGIGRPRTVTAEQVKTAEELSDAGHTHRQIAKAMGKPVSTVGNMLHRRMPKISKSNRGRKTGAPSLKEKVGATSSEEAHTHAVVLGKLGGSKGGVARAKSLTKERRSEIAKKAAKARWDR